jgi:hypothetical protein
VKAQFCTALPSFPGTSQAAPIQSNIAENYPPSRHNKGKKLLQITLLFQLPLPILPSNSAKAILTAFFHPNHKTRCPSFPFFGKGGKPQKPALSNSFSLIPAFHISSSPINHLTIKHPPKNDPSPPGSDSPFVRLYFGAYPNCLLLTHTQKSRKFVDHATRFFFADMRVHHL